MLKTIDDIFPVAKGKASPKRLVLCNAADPHALEAILRASEMGLVVPILTGCRDEIKRTADVLGMSIEGAEIVPTADIDDTIKTAVSLISSGRGDVLMKGGVTTPQIMKGVLNREWGLRTDRMISHLAIFQIPAYHKLLVLTDAAMNIAPSLEEKAVIIQNTVDFMHKLGMDCPKVAALAAIEQVNPKMPATVEADALKQMNREGKITGCTVDGPLSFDLAVSEESKHQKHFDSPVAGDADILLAPDIEAGNLLYKSFAFFTESRMGAVILGAAAPIVLTSRADSMDAKLSSIALAVAGA
ncbi:MAG: bifunctional enoyl-CoA hydratase/phosphate acetyltransferase [Flavobacteriales bacterium]|nr:bifunctional enoyl-CoA hydratase/phosphate acetyltransferase [Flavobacteriales bacterium]